MESSIKMTFKVVTDGIVDICRHRAMKLESEIEKACPRA